MTTSGETSIPSSASIELPPIQVIADYRQAKSEANVASQSARMEEGLQLREGSYLNAVAEVGMLEHSLTTDLLNHLVFVQKVFMKVSLAIFWFDLFDVFFVRWWCTQPDYRPPGSLGLCAESLHEGQPGDFVCLTFLIYFLYVGGVHSLTTDLLNHLGFVQKISMKVHMMIVLIFSTILSSSLFIFYFYFHIGGVAGRAFPV